MNPRPIAQRSPGTPPQFGISTRMAWGIACAVPALAACLVTPWTHHAFAVWDFGELLPLLREGDGLVGTVKALAEYYRSDGRANYLTYLQIAATWEFAGDAPVGWQLQRAILMVGMGVGVVLAGRRMGATATAAGLGGLLATVGASAMEGWSLLMGEPLAAILLLGMLLLAVGYRDAPRWRGRAVALGLLALAVMQTKEVLGLCIPSMVALALCRDADGTLRWPRWDARTRWLGIAMALALVAELSLLLPALADLGANGYASDYGSAGLGAGRAARLVLTMLLPTWYAESGAGAILYPANLTAAILLLAGTATWWRERRRGVPALVLLGVLPVFGAMVYAPWPRYAPFYGLPFWLGGLALLVAAGSVMARRSRAGRLAALVLLAGSSLFAAIAMDRALKERQAHADLAEQLVGALPGWPGVDSLFVVSAGAGARRWPVTGPELHRYAIALGVPATSVPPVVDISCQEAATRLTTGLSRAGLINSVQSCGPLPIRTGVHVASYHYRDWISLARVRDSVLLESLVPGLVPRP